MKKQNVINLIKSHYENDDKEFMNESINIARYFDSINDHQIAEYIVSLMADSNLYSPQKNNFEGKYIKHMTLNNMNSLQLPDIIADDIKGIINAINHKIGINKFLFEGAPGTGKTVAAEHIARLLKRNLYYVDFNNLIDSKLGQTSKNINQVFKEINEIQNPNEVIILFDEIDAIALDRINSNDIREMGRVTSSILREFDRLVDLNSEIVIIATTNLFNYFDKALTRRFDAIINFNRYSNEDLIQIADFYLSKYIKEFKHVSKDTRLFKKILRLKEDLPYPGQLKNIIKTSLAFSDTNLPYDYLRRLYNQLIGNLDDISIKNLYSLGFTVREIEKLKGDSKSTVSRIINNSGDNNE